ncbi:MAG: hypothetical protein ACT4R6_09260 [Gemmatimonadaceae bacterium]
MKTHLTKMLGAAAVLVTALGAGSRAVSAQAVWQADIQVRSLDVSARGGQLSARAVIYSDNDDDARAARVEFLLPVGVGVLRLPAGCKASKSAVAGLHARVTCELGDVEVRGLRELLIVTTRVTGGPKVRFAVFVTSDTPDPSPTNNYAERAVP